MAVKLWKNTIRKNKFIPTITMADMKRARLMQPKTKNPVDWLYRKRARKRIPGEIRFKAFDKKTRRMVNHEELVAKGYTIGSYGILCWKGKPAKGLELMEE